MRRSRMDANWGDCRHQRSTAGRATSRIQVIGFKDGWFLIEGAAYPESDSCQLFTGRGWVEGKFVATHLFRDTLKKAPSNDLPDVSHLYGIRSNGLPYQPYDLEVQRSLDAPVLGSRSRSISRMQRHLSGMPASTAGGTVRGWTDRPCTKGRRSVHASAVRLSLVAAAGRRDGMPTSARSSTIPTRPGSTYATHRTGTLVSSAVCRHLGHWPHIVRAEIQVIGYRKGWFLIEMRGAPPYYSRSGAAPAKALYRPRLGRGEHADGGTAARRAEAGAEREIRRPHRSASSR